jgi:hypothetical protein
MATPPDFSVGQVLTSATMNQVGMWLLETVSITGTTAQFTDGIITNDFNVHKLIVSLDTTQNVNPLIRFNLRNAGSPVTGTNIYRRNKITDAAGATNVFSNNECEFAAILDNAGRETISELTLNNLAFSVNKSGFSQNSARNAGGNIVFYQYAITVVSASPCNGLTISSSTGTLTGSMSLYGVNQ